MGRTLELMRRSGVNLVRNPLDWRAHAFPVTPGLRRHKWQGGAGTLELDQVGSVKEPGNFGGATSEGRIDYRPLEERYRPNFGVNSPQDPVNSQNPATREQAIMGILNNQSAQQSSGYPRIQQIPSGAK